LLAAAQKRQYISQCRLVQDFVPSAQLVDSTQSIGASVPSEHMVLAKHGHQTFPWNVETTFQPTTTYDIPRWGMWNYLTKRHWYIGIEIQRSFLLFHTGKKGRPLTQPFLFTPMPHLIKKTADC
jgi:hypothetical protein